MKPLISFFDRIRNDQRISSTHIGIFAALLRYRVDRGSCNPVHAYSHEIMALAKISAIKTYCRCVRELSDYGYLTYLPSKKKTVASRIYFIE